MKRPEKKASKELYTQLRSLSWEQLWTEETPRFNKASSEERSRRVAVIRAVGVVFSESGDPAHSDNVKRWLIGLLQDPCEKIRRYAMAALPKIGAGSDAEAQVLSLFQTAALGREKKFAARALEKIGGTATLDALKTGDTGVLLQAEQKVKASLARRLSPSAIRLDGILSDFAGVKVHLRGRRGLEGFVRDEAQEFISKHGKFRVGSVTSGLVALAPIAPFTLADIYSLRCFGEVGFVPGGEGAPNGARSIEALASVIASASSRRILHAFTGGTIRYRLNFVDKGHQRATVRSLSERVYALCPEILNDARNVTWTIDIWPGERGESVELRPNLTPDPRFYYRRRDVPAASHPHLAACMARLAGRVGNEIVWDPFCGSGLELIECALLGGVHAVHGTDLSAEAIAIIHDNFAAARIRPISTSFVCCDFREYAARGRLVSGVSLIITNPPMGMRVPVNNLRALIGDLFEVAGKVLRPGGRLVLANPLSHHKSPESLQLQSRQAVDFGGFECRMEKYVKLPRAGK